MKIPFGFVFTIAAALSVAVVSPCSAADDVDDVPEAGEDAKPEKPKKKPRKKPEYKSIVEAEEVAKAWEQPIFAFVDFSGEPLCAQVKMKLIDRCRQVQKEIIDEECVFWHCTVPVWKDRSKNKNNNNNNNRRSGKDRPKPKPDASRLPSEDQVVLRLITGGGATGYPLIALISHENGRVVMQMSFSDLSEATVTRLMRDFKDGMHQLGKKDWKVPDKVQKLIDREEKDRIRAEKMKR